MCDSAKVARVLRSEIEIGKFRPGSLLPSVADLRRRFGLGEFAIRQALALLRRDGLVDIRQHVGTVVVGSATFKCKGRIGFVTVSSRDAYYENSLAFSFSRAMEDEGWAVQHIAIASDVDEKIDLSPLKLSLSAGLDFAVCLTGSLRIAAVLDKACVSYVIIDGYTHDFPNAQAVFGIENKACVKDLVGHLNQLHVRRLLEVDYARVMNRSLTQMLFASGFQETRLTCDLGVCASGYAVERYAFRSLSDYLSKIPVSSKLPDAILFHDDFLARGGALALIKAGVRVPEDIHFITIVNSGGEPFFPFPAIRLNYNWRSYGVDTARYVLGLLSGHAPSRPSLPLTLSREGE